MTTSVVVAADPLGDERRLVGAFALDERAPRDLHPVALDGLELLQREARAHARADRHGRGEAHTVQAVVHAHAPVAERKGRLRQMREQRERQEAMRDRAAERRIPGALAIDVDPLEVVDRLGEGVDALLRDLEPGRDADFLADAVLQVLQRRHAAAPSAMARAMRLRTAGSRTRASSSGLTITPASNSTAGMRAVLP